MEPKVVTFTSIQDFRNRIAHLFQDQKAGEYYDFHFACKDIQDEFDKLIKCFIKTENVHEKQVE